MNKKFQKEITYKIVIIRVFDKGALTLSGRRFDDKLGCVILPVARGATVFHSLESENDKAQGSAREI